MLIIINNPMLRIIALLSCLSISLATLVITTPLVTDFGNNTIDYFYSNFGEIPYGKTQSFDVVVYDESFCGSPDALEHLQKPTYAVIKATSLEYCSWTKRALTAQAIGAKGIIIASSNVQYAKGNVIEADDGNGKKVHITCLFSTYETYDKLRKLKKIEITANFPIPQQKVSTVSIFISAAKRSSYVFLRSFKKEYLQLKNYITLQPLYQTTTCPTCSYDNCYLTDYCCFDYEYGQQNVGQKIIREELHQMAIFSQRGPEKWFEYMNLFDKYCDGNWNNLDQCIKDIVKKMNIEDAYNVDPKKSLEVWRTREILLGFDSFPEIAINNMIYRGNFQVSDIVQAICSSLSSPPAYCQTKTQEVQVPTNQTNSHVVIIILVSIVALIIVIITGICLYRRFIKSQLTRDMSSRVGELVATYASKITTQNKRKQERLHETLDQEL